MQSEIANHFTLASGCRLAWSVGCLKKGLVIVHHQFAALFMYGIFATWEKQGCRVADSHYEKDGICKPLSNFCVRLLRLPQATQSCQNAAQGIFVAQQRIQRPIWLTSHPSTCQFNQTDAICSAAIECVTSSPMHSMQTLPICKLATRNDAARMS